MSNIANIAATGNANPAQKQWLQDFEAVGTALQAGDLLTAKTAFTSFQKALQASEVSATQPFGQNSQANADYANLTKDLQTGDVANAQKAFASLHHDLKSIHTAHRAHHTYANAAGAGSSSASASIAKAVNGVTSNFGLDVTG